MTIDFYNDANAWVALSFVLFLLLIWFKGRKGIVGVLDRKIAEIRTEIDTAQALRDEAQKLFDDYEQKHQQALREAEHVIRTAEKQAEQIRKQAEENINETVRLREKQLGERIDRMKQSAVEEIQRYAADLAIKATAGIIAESLDKNAQDRLIEQTIANVGKNFN